MTGRQIIILAGGKGTRMGVAMPKVLYPVNGQPMVQHLVTTLKGINLSRKPIMVVGYGAEEVKETIGDQCDYALQKEQLGTGHAVSCARNDLTGFAGDVLILYGDHPLVSAQTIRSLFDSHQSGNEIFTMMTTSVPDFTEWRSGFERYGRILRDGSSAILDIREAADCTEEELRLTEVNPGYYCFKAQWLCENITKLQSDNAQGELYLTDLVKIAFAQGVKINSIDVEPLECLGINTPEQLALVEQLSKSL